MAAIVTWSVGWFYHNTSSIHSVIWHPYKEPNPPGNIVPGTLPSDMYYHMTDYMMFVYVQEFPYRYFSGWIVSASIILFVMSAVLWIVRDLRQSQFMEIVEKQDF